MSLPWQRLKVLLSLAQVYSYLGQHAASKEMAREAAAQAALVGDYGTLFNAWIALG